MDILTEAVEFVNKQIEFHKGKVDEFAASNSRRAQHHARTTESMGRVARLRSQQSVDLVKN